MVNVNSKMMMPEFAIDTVVDNAGNSIPGIKRMYDIALAIQDSLMQWGPMGVGKSQAVMQWNAKKVAEYDKRIAAGEKIKPWNPHVCDVRLSMKEPVDLVGVPTIKMEVNGENGTPTTVWATPSMWPKNDGKFSGGVIHLDEINQGQAAILNAAFQLIQDRALGEYKVPEGYIIIGSANQSAFNSTVTEFSLPLCNRFSHFNIKADFDSWFNYNLNKGGNIDILTFLKSQDQGLLFNKKGIEAKVGSLKETLFTDIVVTPRSWEVIGKVLDLPNGTEETGGFTIEEKQRYATGRLGIALASKLFTWLKDKDKYQDWKEILVEGKPFRSEAADQYWPTQIACMSAISNCKDDKKCREYVVNLLKASDQLKSKALQVMNVTTFLKMERLKHNLSLFNPIQDAKNVINIAIGTLKN